MSLTAQVNAKVNIDLDQDKSIMILIDVLSIQMASKRDPQQDKEAQAWIEAITGEKFPAGTYEDALRNGIILIK